MAITRGALAGCGVCVDAAMAGRRVARDVPPEVGCARQVEVAAGALEADTVTVTVREISVSVARKSVTGRSGVGVARADVGINGSRVRLGRVGLGVGGGVSEMSPMFNGAVGGAARKEGHWLTATLPTMSAVTMKTTPSQR